MMRTTFGLRLLLAFTLMGWGQFVFAEDYYWATASNPDSTRYGSSAAACEANRANREAQEIVIDPARSVTVYSITQDGTNRWLCRLAIKRPNASDSIAGTYIFRFGTGCDLPLVLNPVTGSCEAPKDCIDNHNITLDAVCTLNTSAAGRSEVSCPHQVYYEGCSYRRDTSKEETKCRWDIAALPKVYRCQVVYEGGFGSIPPSPDPDAVSCDSAAVCTDPSGNESGANPWDGDTPSANCYMSNGVEICRDPSDSECIKVGGSNTCLADDMNCYFDKLTLQCIPGDKPQRNCTYFNGQYKCFNPQDPSEEIPPESSDHPNNGGNADGDDTNDPRQPGSGDETSQGKDDLATNKSVRDLEDTVGEGFKETNSWLKKIHDALFSGEYDGTGDGKDVEAESSGRATGDVLAQTITDQTQSILEDQEAQSQEFLDTLPSTVTGWFGESGQAVGLANVLDNVLPSASGCTDYTVSFRLGSLSSSLVLPVCDLSRVKPLLEWIIWMITLVGLWKILYSALRRDDVKAAKGGF